MCLKSVRVCVCVRDTLREEQSGREAGRSNNWELEAHPELTHYDPVYIF